MKIPTFSFLTAFLRLFLFGVGAFAFVHGHGSAKDSLKLEIKRALDKGVTWLNKEQNSTSGHWGVVKMLIVLSCCAVPWARIGRIIGSTGSFMQSSRKRI